MELMTCFRIIKTLIYTPWLLSRFVISILFCILPWTRPAREWSLNQAVRVRVVHLVVLYWSLLRAGDRMPLKPGREGNRFSIISPIPAEKASLYKGPLVDKVIKPQVVGATWTPAQPPPAALVGPKVTVGLHFHGGAFVIGDGRDHDTGFLAKTLVEHMGCTHVCTPQYRLASQKGGQFPAHLQDALTCYVHLLKERGIPASQIVLSGDSAGANMALGLLRYIHEFGAELGLPAPGAVSLWSPWVDVSGALQQDMHSSPQYPTDYLNPEFARWGARAVSANGLHDVEGPYLSPLKNPFKLDADTPIFVSGGDREVLVEDIKNFTNAYRELGWKIHLTLSRGAPHDSILLGDRMGFGKEAQAAAREARQFFLQSSGLYLRT